MKKRWALVVAYVLALLTQAGLLAGAYELHVLSQEKMMVMRYLVAKNLELETFWFSPSALLVQTSLSLVLAAGLAVLAVALVRRGAVFAGVQAAVGAALSGAGAWLASSVSASDVWALYGALIAVWTVLLVQCLVVAASARLAR